VVIVGMLLANHYNIDCLVFNPALHSRPIEPNISVLIEDPKPNFIPVVVLGLEDDVINPLITKEILDDALFYCDIEEVEDLGHRIPFYVFVNIYNKYVK
jgi:hypothetical protein